MRSTARRPTALLAVVLALAACVPAGPVAGAAQEPPAAGGTASSGAPRSADAPRPSAVQSLADEPSPPAVEDAVAVVSELADRLQASYVFPDRVPNVVAALEGHRAEGRYDGLDARQLAGRLTEDLRGASGDLHFTLLWEEDAPPPPDPGEEAAARRREAWRREGWGFSRVEVLPGNVGLVELSAFVPPEVAAPAADAALALVADTDALIFDVRTSRGGSGEMVAYLVAHLFAGEPFLLNRFYWRPAGATREMYTPAVAGRRYAERPVYLLTSGSTPSAAEGFSYHLKHLGRATLVGETTAGAAHPVVVEHLDAAPLQIYLPAGRAISPITGTNWEGVGVVPHVPAPAAEALDRAHALALDHLLETETDPRWRRELERVREGLGAAAPDPEDATTGIH
jgi:hypothetical protein